ncbi:uncharacterized [Tachysurus ichikawai]
MTSCAGCMPSGYERPEIQSPPPRSVISPPQQQDHSKMPTHYINIIDRRLWRHLRLASSTGLRARHFLLQNRPALSMLNIGEGL